jgi:hypothetical protein
VRRGEGRKVIGVILTHLNQGPTHIKTTVQPVHEPVRPRRPGCGEILQDLTRVYDRVSRSRYCVLGPRTAYPSIRSENGHLATETTCHTATATFRRHQV